jgi:hypothetical protein
VVPDVAPWAGFGQIWIFFYDFLTVGLKPGSWDVVGLSKEFCHVGGGGFFRACFLVQPWNYLPVITTKQPWGGKALLIESFVGSQHAGF